MGFVPQITCRSCGTKFSALRGRCPNCGARHVKQTGRTAPGAASAPAPPPNAAGARQRPASGGGADGSWQLIFGAVLIVAVITAVIILIVASGNPPEAPPVEIPSPSVRVTTPPPTTPPPTTPPPAPSTTVTGIVITYGGAPLLYDPFTQSLSQPIQLGVTVYPTEALAEYTVEWRCSDENVATVDQTGLVTPVGIGECEIIAECGGVATKCGMWVR